MDLTKKSCPLFAMKIITTARHPRSVDVSDGVEVLLPRVPLALHHARDRAVVLGPVVVHIVIGAPLGGRTPEQQDHQKPRERAHFGAGTLQVHTNIVAQEQMRGSRSSGRYNVQP